MADQDSELSTLLESSKSDRLIKLYMGGADDDKRPFMVPQSTLEASSDYFKNALKHEDYMGQEGERGVLTFGEDNKEAWSILIFWMLKGALLSSVCEPNKPETLLVDCWVLGDKYMIPAFQDHVMLELLRVMDTENITLEAAQIAIHSSTPESDLRRLAMDELVFVVFNGQEIQEAQLDCLDGAPGLAHSLAAAVSRALCKEVPGKCFSTFEKRVYSGCKKNIWGEFMVGSGPTNHWIWTRAGV